MMIDSFTGEYSFLSNFYPAEITWGGIVFPTSEHAYQASKSLDREVWLEMSQLDTPGKAKRKGREIEIREDWNKIKYNYMFLIVTKKFDSHPDLKEKLLSTAPNELIEGNNWGDTYWGVCNGVGKNNLGKILMQIRDNPLNLF